MSAPKNGGPAFPGIEQTVYPSCVQDTPYPGMTVRDYFAAKAMHAELCTAGMAEAPADALIAAANAAGRNVEQQIAFNAYEMADAMLAERERTS